jgi:hypothetical protein
MRMHYALHMRKLAAMVVAALALPALSQTSSLQVHGYLTGRFIRVDSIPSWTERDYGKFDVGGDGAGNSANRETANAQLGIDWSPSSWLLLHADGVARHEPSGTIGSKAGLLQGYVDLFNQHWRLRAGSFWLPTSRENIDPLWTSRYTITYSALNSWIGQEVRPIGADLQWSPSFYVTAGATVFRGNDTMGTELAARGWTLGNRLTVYNESIPQPETYETTKPIERDLDHRNGYAGRLRVQLPERALIQVAHVENRAELAPDIDGQTPWRTRFDVVSASAGASGPTTIAGEYAWGATTVAFPGGTFQMNFATAYLLLSHKEGPDRWSVRVERFSANGAVYNPSDASRERGHAVTVAWLRDSGPHLRYGLEYARVSAHRTDSKPGGSTATAEIRYGF